MSPYAALPLFLASALFQSTLLPRFSAFGFYPQLTLLMVIAWSLLRGPREGALWGFMGGLALDLLSGFALGFNALLLTMAGYFAGLGESRIFRSNFMLPIFLLSTLTLAYFSAELAVFNSLGRDLPWLASFFEVALPTLGLNLLCWPFVFRPLRWLSRITGREELRW